MKKDNRILVTKNERSIADGIRDARSTRQLMQKSIEAFKKIGVGTIDTIADLRAAIKKDREGNHGQEFLNNRLAGIVGDQHLNVGGGLKLKRALSQRFLTSEIQEDFISLLLNW